MSGQLASTFSRLASWVGTAAYMSPERISGSDYSYESDIWSLGLSLWELATGRFPYVDTMEAQQDSASRPSSAAPSSGAIVPTTDDSLLPEEQRLGVRCAGDGVDDCRVGSLVRWANSLWAAGLVAIPLKSALRLPLHDHYSPGPHLTLVTPNASPLPGLLIASGNCCTTSSNVILRRCRKRWIFHSHFGTW